MRTLLTTTLLCLPAAALADCRLEVELLATDLEGVTLTESQKFQMAPLIDEALKRCRIQREAASLEYIAKARRVAGVERNEDGEVVRTKR
jgi:hypothetical protein